MKWGVSPSKISEHNWWDEIMLDAIKLVCALQGISLDEV